MVILFCKNKSFEQACQHLKRSSCYAPLSFADKENWCNIINFNQIWCDLRHFWQPLIKSPSSRYLHLGKMVKPPPCGWPTSVIIISLQEFYPDLWKSLILDRALKIIKRKWCTTWSLGHWKKGKVDRKKREEIKEQMVGRLGGGLG